MVDDRGMANINFAKKIAQLTAELRKHDEAKRLIEIEITDLRKAQAQDAKVEAQLRRKDLNI